MSNTNLNKGGAWGFFTRNIRLTYLLVITICIFGVFSIIQMPKESAPEIDLPIAIVSTTLPGASAEDVETLVTDPIEENVEGISDISSLTSTSDQGLSQITVQFNIDADTNASVTDLRNQVEQASSQLPDDASDPLVQKISFADQPIVTMVVSGDYSLEDLGEFGEDIADRVQTISNVSNANVSGNPTNEYQVEISERALAQYGLSVSGLVSNLQQANVDIPIGSVETSGQVYTVRFAGRLENISDVRDVPVSTASGTTVPLSDIATITEVNAPIAVENRFSGDGENPQRAVSVNIFKESGEGNILSMVSTVQEEIDAMQTNGELPQDLTVAKINDTSEQISADLSNLLTSGAITMVIIFVVLILFLGIREAILASLSVPITFLAGLGILYYLGYTINFLTLFSLILVLGILVDASIVITEGFSEALSREDTPKDAAFATLREFQAPLTVGTLTTVFVFAPMLLAGGIIGEFISTIPVTVSVVLLCALFVALAILTSFGARFFGEASKDSGASKTVRRLIDRAYNGYSQFMEKTLKNSRRRTWIFAGVSLLFIASLALPALGILQTTLFPPSDMNTVTVNMEMPAGTPLAETSQEVSAVSNTLLEDEWVDSILVTAGGAASQGSVTTGANSSNLGGITVSLSDDREFSSTELVARYNDELPEVTNADVTVSQQSSGPESGSPVQVNLQGGADINALQTGANQVVDILEEIDGTQNVESGLTAGGSEFVTTIDREAAARAGITPTQIATLLRARVSGVEATDVKTDGEDTPVMLRYAGSRTESGFGAAAQVTPAELSGTTIQTPQGGSTPLSNLVDFNLGQSLPAINHEGGDRQVTVSSDVAPGTVAPAVVSQVQAQLADVSLPTGVSVSYGGEQEDVAESFNDLFLAMGIGVILIFALLTYQFGSFKQPLYMIATIPLALIGVLFGLAIVGQPLSFPAFIGVVALAGIVVNNAIILIDRVNVNREEGDGLDKAVFDGARSRLQPILLTTITTVGGMIPLLFADPTWAPLAYAIIFGLIFSTVLTLVVVPLLYQRFEKSSTR